MLSKLLYGAPFFVSCLSVLVAAAFAARRWRAKGAGYLIVTCLSAAVYAAFEGGRYLAADLEADMLMTYLQYLGVAFLVPSAILFSLSAFGFEARINRIVISPLFLFAVATIALAWTDPLHHLVYTDVHYVYDGPFPMRHYSPGICWWIIVAYHYLLLAAFTLLLLYVFRTSSGLHRIQAGLLLAGEACVWIVHAVFIAGYSPIPNMDISPITFILVSILMVVGFLRYSLLNVAPIARSEIFRKLEAPILVLDMDNHILDLNPAAEALLDVKGRPLFGFDVGHLPLHNPDALDALKSEEEKEVTVTLTEGTHFFFLRFSPIFNKRGRRIGRIAVFQDISQRKQAEKAIRKAERLRGVLEMAGAVCHDLSQPAMASGGYAELIRSGTPQNDALYAPLTRLIDEVEKLGEINKKLLRITQSTSTSVSNR